MQATIQVTCIGALLPTIVGEIKEQSAQAGGTSPTGRPAQPAELAPAFVFLASQESGFVNGEILGVTGGQPLP
jgi:NAD(P)-dependent dehydrogenase (short-subunit alcohol dehydrogenase family)